MAEASTHLHYADPSGDSRARRRRRAWLLSLVLSAIAVGVVGRMLLGRLFPVVPARFEAIAAQREVDGLPSIGREYEASFDPSGTATTRCGNYLIGRAADRFLRPHLAQPPWSSALAIARIDNAAGVARVLCVTATRGGTRPVDSVTLIAYVRSPATWTGPLPVSPSAVTLPLAAFRRSLQVDPPRLDAGDSRRLLLIGSSDGTPFRFELTLDANDRPSLVALPAPTTRSSS